jgi:2-oxo-4-hydroxy-4-carboxy--5-ureidoimidazoline (OHCU) decarboxylase
MSLELKEVLDFCQAEAIANKLNPNEASLWRSVCREYSSKFYTPLHEVLEMSPAHVILNVLEHRLEDADEEEHLYKMMDLIYTIEDPEYVRQEKEAIDRFVREAEEEEKERIRLGKPIHPGLKGEVSMKTLPEKEKVEQQSSPSGGLLDLSYLENSENER